MDETVSCYRIGWWTHRWWPTRRLLRALVTGKQSAGRVDRFRLLKLMVRNLRLIRRPHRPWQAEAEGLQFARRAFTAEGAKRKIRYDLHLSTGWVTGHPIDAAWQLRRLAKANDRAIRQARVR
jgi:hypothetical protein